MSKSLSRVETALKDAGIVFDIRELGPARTAQQAAQAADCALDQIVKSMVFHGQDSGQAVLFMTAGGNQVDLDKASQAAGEPLARADAAWVRAQTGFAIGGVAPVGHLNPIRAFLDPKLLIYAKIWAAAGTPEHIFEVSPPDLVRMTEAELADFTS